MTAGVSDIYIAFQELGQWIGLILFILSNLGANIKMAYALALGMQGPDGARARSIPKLTLSLT